MLKAKNWNGQHTRYAHLKLDGHRVRVEMSEQGSLSITTRTPTELVHQLEWWKDRTVLERLEPGTAIEGELWVPGQPASYIKTAIKEQDANMRFSCFASHMLAEDASLEDLESWCRTYGIHVPNFHVRNDAKWTAHEAHLLLDDIRKVMSDPEQSAEGFVFKDGNLLNWYKWKPIATVDCFVTGFKDGKGKYEGFVGALECSVYKHDDIVEMGPGATPPNPGEPVVIASVSGMDEETRYDIDEERDLGRVCEVQYQYVGSKGGLRHPRFIRWRDDKKASECTIDQLGDK